MSNRNWPRRHLDQRQMRLDMKYLAFDWGKPAASATIPQTGGAGVVIATSPLSFSYWSFANRRMHVPVSWRWEILACAFWQFARVELLWRKEVREKLLRGSIAAEYTAEQWVRRQMTSRYWNQRQIRENLGRSGQPERAAGATSAGYREVHDQLPGRKAVAKGDAPGLGPCRVLYLVGMGTFAGGISSTPRPRIMAGESRQTRYSEKPQRLRASSSRRRPLRRLHAAAVRTSCHL